jgi:molybdopterin converting factor subunit 1
MANINIEYFAILREHVGLSKEALETDAGTAAELFDELSRRYQFPDIGKMKVAINDEFSEWDSKLADGDSVVFIPPVAGG